MGLLSIGQAYSLDSPRDMGVVKTPNIWEGKKSWGRERNWRGWIMYGAWLYERGQ